VVGNGAGHDLAVKPALGNDQMSRRLGSVWSGGGIIGDGGAPGELRPNLIIKILRRDK